LRVRAADVHRPSRSRALRARQEPACGDAKERAV
jgi:hypothetical protein